MQLQLKFLLLFFKIANFSDPISPLLVSFVDDFGIQLWKDCCQAAEKCCQMMLESHNEGKKLIDHMRKFNILLSKYSVLYLN